MKYFKMFKVYQTIYQHGYFFVIFIELVDFVLKVDFLNIE